MDAFELARLLIATCDSDEVEHDVAAKAIRLAELAVQKMTWIFAMDYQEWKWFCLRYRDKYDFCGITFMEFIRGRYDFYSQLREWQQIEVERSLEYDG